MSRFNKVDKVSIIIPIYNVERYLPKCLDSILEQIYKNIEVILVDDGSTDGSLEIAKKYALKDNRIKIITKQNGGLSDARNAGLACAEGDYIMFVDSDDYVDIRFVEAALQNIKKYNADISCFRFTYVNDDEIVIKVSSVKTADESKVYSNVEGIVDIFSLGGTLKVNAWNKIYRRGLFTDNKITYPVGRLYEDNLTTYKLMYRANKITYFNEPLLFYRQRPGSIMKNRLTSQNIRERIGMLRETISWLSDKIAKQDLDMVRKVYAKTLFVVLASESFAKRQPYMIPIILSELAIYNIKKITNAPKGH